MRTCKICGGPLQQLYTIKGVPFYHCVACNFLQNFVWEEHPNIGAGQREANAETRERLWPPGERALMREKGWEMLELMTSPIAWRSRIIHTQLSRIPLYRTLTRRRARRRLRRILDFGCGHGVTALELRAEGFESFGLDPFSPVDDHAIYRVPLPAAKFPDASFDGIYSIETLEHIPNVLETFAELRRILRPGGVLLVQTRRLEDPDYLTRRQDWFYLQEPTTHVSIYSEPAMRRIAEKVGFSSVAFRSVRLARFVN